LGGGDGRSNVTNVQCKAFQNCCNESPLCNEYILIKMEEKILTIKHPEICIVVEPGEERKKIF
jgi:hypothetical protein